MADKKLEQQTEHRDLFDLERAERSSSVAAEHDSDIDQDLEEMDSQLNPDAKEFVPVSPQRTAMSSPFGNGGLHNRIDLIDDDVVSQSPRKGSAIVMDDNDIVLPAENDFTEISKRPSELLADEISNENDVQPPENVNLLVSDVHDVQDVQRPESSNSQCSYQEMNLKEAMHGDEKQELAAEMHDSDNLLFGNGDDIAPITNGEQPFLNEQNPMNMSFYNDENNPFNSGEVDMNAVQRLPDDIEDDENEMSDFVAQPIENSQQDQAHLQQSQQTNFVEFGENESNSNQQPILIPSTAEESTPITSFVQALATEVTSILNEVNEQGNEGEQMEVNQVSQPEGKINRNFIRVSSFISICIV